MLTGATRISVRSRGIRPVESEYFVPATYFGVERLPRVQRQLVLAHQRLRCVGISAARNRPDYCVFLPGSTANSCGAKSSTSMRFETLAS
jgi:hypothetical protein